MGNAKIVQNEGNLEIYYTSIIASISRGKRDRERDLGRTKTNELKNLSTINILLEVLIQLLNAI